MTWKNPEDEKLFRQRYYQENKNRIKNRVKENSKKYYQKHKQEIKEKVKQYQQKNPIVARMAEKKYKSKIRAAALKILGGKCRKCGTTRNLHLHHKYYARDSVRPIQNGGSRGFQRNREAIKHPERFSLLCLSCHSSVYTQPRKLVNISVLYDRQEECE